MLYYRNEDLGKRVFWIFSVIMFAIGAHQTFKSQFLPSFDVIYDTATDLYTAPWVRITPYIVGVGCGYVLEKYKERIRVEKVNFKYFRCHN